MLQQEDMDEYAMAQWSRPIATEMKENMMDDQNATKIMCKGRTARRIEDSESSDSD